MSDDVMTVQTPFGDIADLAQGFIGRVTARQIVVNVADVVESGQPVRFQVLLADGTLAFWADGQCGQVSDLGEEAEPEGRYEVLLHSLEFPDERSLPVFEYMVSLSESATPSEELTASGEPLQSASDAAELVDDAEQPVEDGGFAAQELGTADVDTGELEAFDAGTEAALADEPTPPTAPRVVAAAPARPVAPVIEEPALPRALSDRPGPPPGGLTRMSTGMAWRPTPPERREPAPRSGLFAYAFGPLPLPSRPPRPELDASYRVTPAPRPPA